MPIIVLFIVYSSVKSNIILQDTDFLSLLMNHKGKFIFYFFVSFIEEVIFRGIIFGLLLQKCKNKYLSCVIAALIFTLPHIFNTDNISVLVMFIFPFLYGIFANEMFYTTKSIWMPTGFHWLWNYTITSLFLVTGTQSFIYVPVAKALGTGVEKQLLRRALTKGTIYPIVKSVSKWFGVRMTKQIFAGVFKKAIPVVGGVLGGGITYLSFKPCCDKLKASLQNTILSNPDYQNSETEDAILAEFADVTTSGYAAVPGTVWLRKK